jgi:hypothetical protein
MNASDKILHFPRIFYKRQATLHWLIMGEKNLQQRGS